MKHKHHFLGVLFATPLLSLVFLNPINKETTKITNNSSHNLNVPVKNATIVYDYSELINAIESGETFIQFGNDIIPYDVEWDSAIYVSEEQDIYIDGNNYTFSAEVTGANEQGILNENSSSYTMIYNAGTLHLYNMTIRGGGNVAVSNYMNLYMDGCTIERSGSPNSTDGGGLYNYNNAYVKNSKFSRNNADHGGGFLNSGLLIMDSCSLNENRSLASNGGGGGGENGASLIMNNCTVVNNTSTEIGGAINCNTGGITAIANSTITGNISSTTEYGTEAGGGIGINGSTLIFLNSIASNNYFYDSGKRFDDFGLFSADPLSINMIHSAYGHVMGQEDTEIPSSEFYSAIELKQIPDPQVPEEDLYFSTYVNQSILGEDGDRSEELFRRPIITKCANNTYVAPIKSTPMFCQGGTNVYLNVPDDISTWESIEDIKFGYGKDGNITTINGFSEPSVEDVITVYQDGSNRDLNNPVMGACKPTDTEYCTLTVVPGENGSVSGGSIYGDSYPKGTQISLFAVPDEGYALKRWINADDEAITYPSDTFINYHLTESITVRPEFISGTNVYTITNLAPEEGRIINGGYVKANPTGIANDMIAIQVFPFDRYDLKELKVYDENYSEIEVKNGKFKMPSADVTIDATFVAIHDITNLSPYAERTNNHGYIIIDATSATFRKVTVEVFPNQGYVLESIKVTSKDGTKTIEVTNNEFTMPDYDVVVTATFVASSPIPPGPTPPSNCIFHWISLAFTLINVVIFALFTFIIRKFKCVKLIICAVSSIAALVLAIVGASICACGICVAFIVINAVVLLAEGILTYFDSKKKDKDDDNDNNIDSNGTIDNQNIENDNKEKVGPIVDTSVTNNSNNIVYKENDSNINTKSNVNKKTKSTTNRISKKTNNKK